MSYGKRRQVGSGYQPFMAHIIFDTQREVRELRRRVAILEMETHPIWNLPIPERVKLGMQGLFQE